MTNLDIFVIICPNEKRKIMMIKINSMYKNFGTYNINFNHHKLRGDVKYDCNLNQKDVLNINFKAG